MPDSAVSVAAIAVAALALGAGLALAGPFGEEEASRATSLSAGSLDEPSGHMTAHAIETTHVGTTDTVPPFYASRVVTIEGTLTLGRLPVALANVNGPIDVHVPGEARADASGGSAAGVEVPEGGDRYRLVVNLTGYGSTPEQAREARSQMHLEWSAGEPGDRRLVATVEHEQRDQAQPTRREAPMHLVIPADVDLDLEARSTNGDVRAEGIAAPLASLESTNGAIHARLDEVARASLTSTNGPVDAALTPTASGEIQAATTNADVDVRVPETGDHGYDATARSTNGEPAIELEDGETQTSEDEVRFLTHGFDERAIQTTLRAVSTNGDVTVGPR